MKTNGASSMAFSDTKERNWSTEFATWLSQRWSSEPFRHKYTLREKGRSTSGPKRVWTIDNLLQAKDGYTWNGKCLADTEAEVTQLRQRLLGALTRRDELEALNASFDILKWGKVFSPTKHGERASVVWLKRAHADHNLCFKLTGSVDALKQGDCSRFDGKDLMMNSGITKIVSFADPEDKLIIYDGRVGAALGYLVRLFLQQSGTRNVPNQLLYGWGGAKTKGVNRNPSTETYRFPGLWQGAEKDRSHARMMFLASDLIDHARRQTSPQTNSRDWEAALFMVGYEVPGTPEPVGGA